MPSTRSDGEVDETFATVFRAALEATGRSLTWVRDQLSDRGLPVSLAALSYWRSGARRPDAANQRELVSEIEGLLDLQPGTLLSLARTRTRALPDPIASFPGLTEDEANRMVAEALAALKAPPDEWICETSSYNVVDVGRSGLIAGVTSHTVIECVEGRLERIVYVDLHSIGDGYPPSYSVLAGGRIVEEYESPDGALNACAVELERTLEVGDSILLVVRFDPPEGYSPAREAGTGVSRRARKVAQWVRFHPDALPDWIIEIETVEGAETHRHRALDAANSVHHARWDFGPGSLAFRWGYGPHETGEETAP